MARRYDITKMKIAKLDLKAGDVLVVKIIGEKIPMDVMERIEQYLALILPAGVKPIIYHKDQIELSIITPEVPPP